MHKPILLASTAALFALMSASYAQIERRETQSPPASGSQSEPAVPSSDAPGTREPKARGQRDNAPGADENKNRAQQRPAADERKQTPSQAQSPRNAPDNAPANAQRPTQDNRAQDRSAPQRPSAQSPAQDNQPSRAQAPADSRQGAQGQVSTEQRTRINQSLARTNVHRVASVNFNVSIGTAVPRSVRFVPLPATIVSIVPQYRGYHYAVVRDEIVIIEPATRRVVYVMPYSAGRAAVSTKRKVSLSRSHRDFVRQSVRPRPAAQTTGSASTVTEIIVGETVPEAVVIERFPDPVYRRVPALRSYQYIQRGEDIYLVDRERRVIEVID